MKRTIKVSLGDRVEERVISYIPGRYIAAMLITIFEVLTMSIKDIKKGIDDTLNKSIEITPSMLRTNLLNRFFRALVRIFAPML